MMQLKYMLPSTESILGFTKYLNNHVTIFDSAIEWYSNPNFISVTFIKHLTVLTE